MNLFQGLFALLGRILLAGIFLMSALGNKIPKFNEVAGYMASAGVPQPKLALVGAIVFLLLGSLSLILGYYARFGSVLLIIFLILATAYFHAFWKLTGSEAELQMLQFMKNSSILGGLVFVLGMGSGPWSLDRIQWRKK
ncbi:MAG: DoxX family protein [Zavarzinella sp.]